MHLLGTIFSLFVGLFLVVGCNVQSNPEENSGPDQTRNGAVEFPIERTIIDNVSFDTGDKTDWKYFSVPSAGLVDIMVAFDNHDAKGTVRIRDGKGLIITKLEDHGEPLIQNTFRGDPGYYYLEIWCDRLATDYTIEIHFQPL